MIFRPSYNFGTSPEVKMHFLFVRQFQQVITVAG